MNKYLSMYSLAWLLLVINYHVSVKSSWLQFLMYYSKAFAYFSYPFSLQNNLLFFEDLHAYKQLSSSSAKSVIKSILNQVVLLDPVCFDLACVFWWYAKYALEQSFDLSVFSLQILSWLFDC